MRCPKCSYISFDMLETCVKCGKKISDAATELEGTVASVPAPSFLRIGEGGAPPPETPEEAAEFETEEAVDLGAEGGEEMEFSLGDEPSAEADEVELNLGGEEETEAELDFAGEEEAEAELDLGEGEAEIDAGEEEMSIEPEEESAMDISDLSPTDETEELSAEEPFEETVQVGAEEAEALGEGGGAGLESLEVEGIDLDTSDEAQESGKIMPSVKTGTALDDFDIDLGDLLTGKEED